VRIAVFANEQEMSSYYRAFEPVHALGDRGHEALINGRDGTAAPEMLDFDVALISRYQGMGAQKLAEQLRRAGLAIVWGHDDAVERDPNLNPRALNVQRRKAEIRAMLALADVVVTTSESLAETYREMGARSVHVIENHLGDHYADLHRPPHDGLVLGWAAWIDHQADWKQLGLHATVSRLLDAHPQLRVESVGLIDLGLPSERYTRTDAVPFEQLGRQLVRFDIGIAPIVENPFNRARSNIKVKEYAAAGVPWLASPIGPYAELGEKQGGRLVPDDRWYEALHELISSGRLRRKLAKRGRRWAEEEMLARHAGEWEAAFTEAIERGRTRRGAVAV
jgi:glycosyltransferase involved in cell wall biosynthesis